MKFTIAKIMTKGAMACCLTFMICHSALSQKATEKFIPLGKSPGVSGKSSVLGEVQSINTKKYSLTMKLATGTKEIHIERTTKIYIDRSNHDAANRDGKWEDILPGMTIEVKYVNEKTNLVDWVKLQAK